MQAEVGLESHYPEAEPHRRLSFSDVVADPSGFWRRLAGGSDSDFCTDSMAHHYHMEAECAEYHGSVLATTIFATIASSALLGIMYFGPGQFRMTRYVSYVPTSVQEAFLSCVGYKVFKYVLNFCKYDPRQFIPAACVSVELRVSDPPFEHIFRILTQNRGGGHLVAVGIWTPFSWIWTRYTSQNL